MFAGKAMFKGTYLLSTLFLLALIASPGAVSAFGKTPSSSDAKLERYRKRVAGAFIADKAKLPGALTLPSGLVFEIVRRGGGGGRGPALTDECAVHYVGTLRDGTVFDSSRKRGQPANFRPSEVIPAWAEALRLMREGDQWRIYVPPELGYAARGAGANIPPHAALEFEMELVSIKEGGNGRTSEEIDEVIEAAKKRKSGGNEDL